MPQTHHIVPRAAGGTDDPANLIALCFPCHWRWCMNPLGLRSPETGIRTDLLGGTEPPRTTLWG